MRKIILFLVMSLLLIAEQDTNRTVISPLGGKEILVVEAKNCKFCKQFNKDVLSNYHGTIPLRVVNRSDIRGKGFKLNRIKGTPTIILIRDGKEVYSYRGYMEEKLFYKALAIHKLGLKSEAFKVAFKKHTDNKFCKQYEKFKNVGDGIFIDKISGEPLFDSKDRFNSGSGWLSFYKAIDGATIQKDDNSSNMNRIEVIAKKSGAHLGHVFNDAPNGKKRFCINATILEFIPRGEVNKKEDKKSLSPIKQKD